MFDTMFSWFFLILFLSIVILILKLLRKLKIKHNDERYVLVTGCDSGFGNLLTKQLDVMGFRVFACCLTKTAVDELTSQCSRNVVAVEMDVSADTSIDQAMDIVKMTIPRDKGLWAVVNNAGVIGEVGPTEWQTRQDYDKVMAVNLYGVIMVTKACMPLVLKERGRFINTASIMGRFAFVNPTYCVSKFGVEAFSDVIRRELYKTGVSVHIIEPGFFKTPLLDKGTYRRRLEAKVQHLPSEIQVNLPNDEIDLMANGFSRFTDVASPNVTEVVDAYIHAITARYPKNRYLVGFDANYIFQPLWHLPEWLSDWLIVKMVGR